MRILYFHQHFSTRSGSAGTRSYEFAKRLVERGHQVTMICGSYGSADTGLTMSYANGKRSGVVSGINVIEFELPYSNRDSFMKRTSTFIKFALRSIAIALRDDYDLLFATSTPLTAGIPGIAASFLRRKPFVFEIRDLWPELPRAMSVITNPVILTLMSILEWLSYHSARLNIGLAPGIVDGIKRRGISGDRVAFVPNGCDLDLFRDQAVRPWRPQGVAETDLMTVFAGTHGLANGLDAILDAAAELARRGRNDIKMVLIGDGKSKPALVERARREKLSACVFCDPVPKVQLAGLLNSADAGLMVLANVPAFYFGTSPNKFFDYIAAGIPILNNYPGWVAEMIDQNSCGIAVPPEDPKAFADALERMADDRQALKRMGANGRRLAAECFDRSHLADTFAQLLEKVAERD